jgi:hypothetical protein
MNKSAQNYLVSMMSWFIFLVGLIFLLFVVKFVVSNIWDLLSVVFATSSATGVAIYKFMSLIVIWCSTFIALYLFFRRTVLGNKLTHWFLNVNERTFWRRKSDK